MSSNVIHLSDLPAHVRARLQTLPKTPARKVLDQAARSTLETALERLLRNYLPTLSGLPDLVFVRQCQFCPWRDYRADFAELRWKVLIEMQGGAWVKGQRSHAGATGLDHDAERLIIAQSLGWDVLPVTRAMLDQARLLPLLASYFRARAQGL